MTTHSAHQQRVEAGIGFHWDQLPPYVDHPADYQPSASMLRLQRIGNSHNGIASCKSITDLWAKSVNSTFLAEICELDQLEFLYLEKVMVADLSPLKNLKKLRRLFLRGATKVENLNWLEPHSNLKILSLENLPRVKVLDQISAMTKLTALAFEGSMWTAGQITTLAPLAGLSSLQCLCLTNVRVADNSLRPLHSLQKLAVLQCANFFPSTEFILLQAANPHLQCQWFCSTKIGA